MKAGFLLEEGKAYKVEVLRKLVIEKEKQ